MNTTCTNNNISINKTNPYNKFILKYDWDFFITICYETKRKTSTIRKHITDLYNKSYWIERLIFVKEDTKTGLPHIHFVIKTKDKQRSLKTLNKILKQYGNTDIQDFDNSENNNVGGYMFKDYKNPNNDYDFLGIPIDEKKLLRERYFTFQKDENSYH